MGWGSQSRIQQAPTTCLRLSSLRRIGRWAKAGWRCFWQSNVLAMRKRVKRSMSQAKIQISQRKSHRGGVASRLSKRDCMPKLFFSVTISSMRFPQPSTIHIAVSWAARVVGAGYWGYALYAVYLGRVRVGSRSTDVVIELAVSPGPFVSAVLLYVGGGILCFWIAKRIANH